MPAGLARGLNFGGEVTPDLTIYLDLAPDAAVGILEARSENLFTAPDIHLQAACFNEELACLPKDRVGIIAAGKAEEKPAAGAMAALF